MCLIDIVATGLFEWDPKVLAQFRVPLVMAREVIKRQSLSMLHVSVHRLPPVMTRCCLSANAVLGYLPPSLLGGTFALDIDAARKAVQDVADAVGLSLYDAAEGILKLADEKMFGALRNVSVEQGHDSRDFRFVH